MINLTLLKRLLAALLAVSTIGTAAAAQPGLAALAESFAKPPPSARPWVYWFWVNSNVTREGITADLESMKRAGVGGVLLMDVNQGVPEGKIRFMDDQWQAMFAWSVKEAKRLGLEYNFNDGVGWNGTGGPWIPPELAQQRIFTSETHIQAGATGTNWSGTLPLPSKNKEYRDIAVFAVPESAAAKTNRFQISDFETKTLSWGINSPYRHLQRDPAQAAPAGQTIPVEKVIDLTTAMRADGSLSWNAPAGEWTLLRVGHAWSGRHVEPALPDHSGPECDKLSKAAMRVHFNAFNQHLMDLVGKDAKGALVATHIDSWEAGGQNWTPGLAAEFKKRRGYDPIPYLPILAGRVLGDLQTSERFLYDLRQTVSEMMVENYTGEFQRLAHRAGLRNSFESYTTGGNDLDNANFVDELMAEFWTPAGGGLWTTVKSMSSVAHVNGQAVVGAEAFTSDGWEKWQMHPAAIKSLGDAAFCGGINRFVIHRNTAQPYGENIKPGAQMGPWGLHYDRGNTWWDFSGAWHEYLARCQYLLRQGRCVADVLKVESEEPMDRFEAIKLNGYDYDACGPASFMRARVRDRRVVFPSGASYRLAILPHTPFMSVKYLAHIRQLVKAGAVVLGEPPRQTPGLKDHEKADAELKEIAGEIWGADSSVTDRRFGKGRVFRGITPEQALAALALAPDFTSDTGIKYIHRQVGNAEVYFLSHAGGNAVSARCTFRVAGRQPEFWWPDTGRISWATAYEEKDGATTLPVTFEPSGSVFVVFRKAAHRVDPIVSTTRNGKPFAAPKIIITKARYGVLDDPQRTRDVTAKLQAVIGEGRTSFGVTEMAKGDDPAYGVIKTLVVDYTVAGESWSASGKDPETISLSTGPTPALDIARGEIWQNGDYVFTTAAGKNWRINAALPAPQPIAGPWNVAFDPRWGGPASVTFATLEDWSKRSEDAIRYYSGSATYRTTFRAGTQDANSRTYLDLGKVQVMARVRLNGKDLGTLWKPPYRVDVTSALKAGDNNLEIDVVTLWINRLIGDEQLPDDTERHGDGSLKKWPQWLIDGKPNPNGRFTFTTWQLWHKNDPLRESGLIGPVALKTVLCIKP